MGIILGFIASQTQVLCFKYRNYKILFFSFGLAIFNIIVWKLNHVWHNLIIELYILIIT
jgi:hypothetical protein